MFFEHSVIWCVGRPWPDMRTSVTSTRSKVKVMELPKLRTLHFCRSVSSAVLAWSSNLMVDSDIMGPGLQLVGAQFSNFFSERYHESSNFAECRYFITFKQPYFRSAWCYSQMVGHAGSATGIVYAHVTLTWSKVKVTGLLNFQKLSKIALYVYLLRHFAVQLTTDSRRW